MSIPPPDAHKPVDHSAQEDIHAHYTLLWNLRPSSVDAPVDIHGRSHSFIFIHPREVFLAWHWVITRPLSSCGVVLLSLPSGVGLTGVRLVHLSHTWQTPMHVREHQLLMQWGGAQLWCRTAWISLLVFHFIWWDVCHWSDILPHEACPPTCPWSSSSLERHLPWLRQDCQASNLWCLFSQS